MSLAAVLAIGAILAAGVVGGAVGPAYADNGVSPALTPFVDPLPIPPVATPQSNPLYPGADYYRITESAHPHQFHRDLGDATVWSYGAYGQTPVLLGPTIIAKTGRPVVVKYINQLPTDLNDFPLKDSIDLTIPGSDLPSGRAIPHLHGGHSASQYDGTPDQWWTAGFADTGMAFYSDTFKYMNDQPASLIWYHDHSMAVTRMQPYLGLAAAYLIVDNVDSGSAIRNQKVPSGPYHIPLVLQDKTFNDDGTLWYPTQGISAVHPVWVPEFFADTPVINGKAYPYLDAQPRRYRFRLINGSNARFYGLHFQLNENDLPFWVIGSDGGLLPRPVAKTTLLIAPGERYDLIVDFTGVPLDSVVMLTNDAPAPYPGGGETEIPVLMQINVNTPVPATDPDRSVLPSQLKLISRPNLLPTPGIPPRDIVLKENADEFDNPVEVMLNGYHFMDPTTDFVKKGTVETWNWINLTGDAHPMHIHLVQFAVVNRQAIDVDGYTTAWLAYLAANRDPALKPNVNNYLIGAPIPPAPEDMGLKDTVKVLPGFVTRVRAKFTLPSTSKVSIVNGRATYGEWVYHCHILEHEENDMMRPFEVVP